jgi:hypothetical protein
MQITRTGYLVAHGLIPDATTGSHRRGREIVADDISAKVGRVIDAAGKGIFEPITFGKS